MAFDPRTPVVIVAGFLGAGKTTLLKSILANPGFSNTMVIVNEIGEIGIDHQLLERSEDETVLLDNGCMCCQLRGDLQSLLVNLKMRVERGEIPSFERVVIEMSGLADPGPVAQTLYSDAALIHHYRIARIVTLLDPLHAEARKAAPAVAEAQVATADMLIISKTDVADETQVCAAVEWAKSINEFADCTSAKYGDVDAALLASLETSDDARIRRAGRPLDLSQAAGMGLAQSEIAGAHDASVSSEGSYLARRLVLHPSSVSSFVFRIGEPPTRPLFDLFLSTLVRLRGQDLLRVKGIVYFEDCADPYLIQGVRHIFAEPVVLNAASVTTTESLLVFVAKDVTQRDVESLWRSLSSLAG